MRWTRAIDWIVMNTKGTIDDAVRKRTGSPGASTMGSATGATEGTWKSSSAGFVG